MPVATLRARSRPSQVFEHFGAPPITPTDESPHNCSTNHRWALLFARDLVDAHHGKRVMTINDHLHTLAFFFDVATGRFG